MPISALAGSHSVVASIPSPSFNSIDIGPLSLNIYGLAIALGVVAAVWLFGKRLEERGAGTTDDASSIAIWAVLAGVIGARLYHVATDWDRFIDNYAAIPKLWEGGLGIPGGLAFGIPTGLLVARRKGISMSMAATCAAPAIPLAQAIGRLGNYFNQELYGRPTDLPWALEIDDAHLLEGFASGTTFHPTFLYEMLWSLALCAVLLWIDRKYRPPLGQLMPMYVIGYGLGRFWVEGLRIDRADELAGLRWNQWVAVAAVIGGGVVLAFMRRHPVLESADPLEDREELVTDVLAADGELDGELDGEIDDDVAPESLTATDVDESDDASTETAPDTD
ncbi:MAG: prolipoprotein diacylglyceryl transferase [Ilumatobacter sp.]|uniref:prolipoprotein diacylglyceryl transferase n=1 Tax=Ilumatobacter sp. TaxID=1967498 RepID=UPI001DBB6BB8|nr:prolipoprotein diacylglyceryl transferase [Ilumatobacter sp.]MBT5552200.1 prolipoprotein diacylglyceryl transferase [Ilumatobacter sp.]